MLTVLKNAMDDQQAKQQPGSGLGGCI